MYGANPLIEASSSPRTCPNLKKIRKRAVLPLARQKKKKRNEKTHSDQGGESAKMLKKTWSHGLLYCADCKKADMGLSAKRGP